MKELKNTNEAIDRGKMAKGKPEEIRELKSIMEFWKEKYKAMDNDHLQKKLDVAFKIQFYHEALMEAEK